MYISVAQPGSESSPLGQYKEVTKLYLLEVLTLPEKNP